MARSRRMLSTYHRMAARHDPAEELARDVEKDLPGSEIATLYAISKVLTSILEIGSLLEQVLDLAIREVQAERGLIILFHPQTGEPEVVADEAGDLFGHGTACGGLIVDLAPEVEIVSVRVLGPDLKGRGAAFLGGLDWAIDQGVDVINLSLSSKSEALYVDLHEVVDRAYFAGTTLVSAANNSPGASYPSLFSSVISVAAHEEPDPWRWYYNPRPPVEFGAWGMSVPIAWKDGGSTVATGNSFAAPHIAALAALLISKRPGLTPFEVKAVLAATADGPRSGGV